MIQPNTRRSKCGLTQGDKVVIVESWSADVLPGTEGVISKRMPRGYAVDVRCWFTDAIGKRRRFEARCMFFSAKELRRIPSSMQALNRPSTSTPKSEVRRDEICHPVAERFVLSPAPPNGAPKLADKVPPPSSVSSIPEES